MLKKAPAVSQGGCEVVRDKARCTPVTEAGPLAFAEQGALTCCEYAG